MKQSKNARNAKIKNREKFGIRIPRNVREALQFDRENGNTKWADAIAKEMNALQRLNCFQVYVAQPQAGKERWMAIRTSPHDL